MSEGGPSVAAERAAGWAQGWSLVATAWLAVIATSLISPVLPRMATHFSRVGHASDLIQFTIALPALFVAVLAAPLGHLADKVGRRPVLLVALAAYGVFGMAPLFLDSLPLILVSRCGVGAAEAAVITASTALLGDYFQGASRERWFAAQMGSANLVAVGVLALGGALGEISWRAPFVVYALPFLLAVLVLSLTWEPVRAPAHADGAARATGPDGGGLAWRRLLLSSAVTAFGSMAFYVVVIQFSFIMTSRGYASPAQIGMGAALAAVGVPVGSVAFRMLAKVGVALKLLIAFMVAAVGFVLIALGPTYFAIVLGAAINGLGCGIYLPTLLTSALTGLRLDQRGRGSGIWQAAFFLGQFLSPISVIQLSSLFGGTPPAVLFYAALCGVGGLIALSAAAVSSRSPRDPGE
ncbi:MFS transporter [Phenylobacterium montanum]|uniref:MFS transporter n=1 Tax=Phenylobacterium montanum TaxID=2823693 RepID=A0A975G3N8_9CAUL|nr:MFS transporter [Caulobacter sp. S6]QUD90214.1 MFS transporter [Caulobacter sp. S6]